MRTRHSVGPLAEVPIHVLVDVVPEEHHLLLVEGIDPFLDQAHYIGKGTEEGLV